MYSDADIAGVKCKNVSFKDETVESILAICLKGTGLNFAIEEKTIVIWKGNPVKQIVEKEWVLKGLVVDEKGQPLPGATVILKGTALGVVTDTAGIFKIALPDGDKHVEYAEGIFVGYRGYDKLKREVQYPFGYGLSYTRFKLSAPTVGTPKTDGSVTVTCKLTNTGRTAGAEVVQLYVSNKDTTVEHPEKELKGFRKVYLEPGETKSIEITVPAEAFSHYDTGSRRFVIDRGSHDILLGFSSRDIKAKMSVGISR